MTTLACAASLNTLLHGLYGPLPSEYTLSAEERRQVRSHVINVALLIGVVFGAYTTWFRFEVLDLENGRTTDDIEAWIVSLTLAFILSLRFGWSRYLWRTTLRWLWLLIAFTGRMTWWLVLVIAGRRSEKMPTLRPDPKLARERYEAPQRDWMRRRAQKRR